MAIRMIDTQSRPTLSQVSEKELRRQINKSVSRALVDGDYLRLLLADPTLVLEERGCALPLYRSLQTIKASSLLDFAHQARRLFWAVDATPAHQEDQRQLAAAAAV
jgi:hypothetical protein